MFADVNVENEKLIDDFFDSKQSKGMIVELNKEEDYILIKDSETKEIIKVEIGTGLADTLEIYDLPLYICYNKETKMIVNP